MCIFSGLSILGFIVLLLKISFFHAFYSNVFLEDSKKILGKFCKLKFRNSYITNIKNVVEFAWWILKTRKYQSSRNIFCLEQKHRFSNTFTTAGFFFSSSFCFVFDFSPSTRNLCVFFPEKNCRISLKEIQAVNTSFEY